jgi:hypothetical protein
MHFGRGSGATRRALPEGHHVDRKVFGIGFQKTGTTSLGLALEELGYRVCGKVGVHRRKIGSRALDLACARLEDYDAFQDNPWPLLYRELDTRCPGSRFILTTRPSHRWIQSVCRHFGETSTPMREWIYGAGSPLGNEDVYLQRYEAHNAAVREYFASRPSDLLELPMGEQDGWNELCEFLGHPVPQSPFPHGNSQADREARRSQPRPWWSTGSLRRRFSGVAARWS